MVGFTVYQFLQKCMRYVEREHTSLTVLLLSAAHDCLGLRCGLHSAAARVSEARCEPARGSAVAARAGQEARVGIAQAL